MKVRLICLLLTLMLPAVALPTEKEVRSKILMLVKHCQEKKKGTQYCKDIEKFIWDASKLSKIDPYIIAATAYVESKFHMHSSPQIGIMQFTRSTWENNFGPKGNLKKGLNPYEAAHNILAGAIYLEGHRKGSKGNLIDMWSRYNSGQPASRSSKGRKYATRATTIYKHLKEKSVGEYKKYLSNTEVKKCHYQQQLIG